MRTISERFAASVRQAHVIAARCTLTFPGESEPVSVPIVGGSVTMDRRAASRRVGQVAIPWSLDAGSDLDLDLRTLAYGGYALLERGVRYASGAEERVSLGVFRVESVSWQTIGETASLELSDRMAQVRDEPFLSPYVPKGGSSLDRMATLTDNSPVVTGLATTGDLLLFGPVSGPGIPADTIISSIDSGTQITLSKPANIFATKSCRVWWGQDTLSEIGDASDLFLGMAISGPWPIAPGGVIDWKSVNNNAVSSSITNYGALGQGFSDIDVSFTLGPAQLLTFGGGERIADAAIAIVREVFGDAISYLKPRDPNIVPLDVFFSRSRADTLAELAKAAAAEAYFDGDGNFVFGVAPGAGEPVWIVDSGEGGVMVDASEALARTGVFNGVLIEGQVTADTPPISVLVTDDDPLSPTRWAGPFGKVAHVDSSGAVQSAAQAEASAQAILDSQLGLARSLTLIEAPNPALEPGDLIEVRFPDGRSERHVVDSIALDLGAQGAQTIATRSIYTPAALERLIPVRRRRYGRFVGRAAWAELRDARRVA